MTPLHERTEHRVARFSRRWWIGCAHSLFWVALATILIWIYADMEFTDEAELNIKLDLKSKTVALLGDERYDLEVVLSGAKTALETFRDDLTACESVLTYDVSQEYGTGKTLIPAAVLLERAAGLQRRGISVKDIQPEAISLHLDKLISIPDVPIELDAQGAKYKVLQEPPKVTIHVAESRWAKIQELLNGQPVKLKTKPVDLKNRSAEKPILAEIHPFLEGIIVTPAVKTVTFHVEILSQRVTEEIPVTVRLLTPIDWAQADNPTWRDYVFVPNPASDWRPRLKIEGEPKHLAPENVRAYIPLTDDDKKGTDAWLPRDVVVAFPPQTDLRLIGPAPKVQFRLEKRKPTVAPLPALP